MARRRVVESEVIRQAAAELLAALPPAEVTVAAVARAANVSTGTVYNYFRDKEHLLAAAAGVPGAVSAWVDPEPGQSRRDYLAGLARAALERFRLVAGRRVGAGRALRGSAEAALSPGVEDVQALRDEVASLAERLAAHAPAELPAARAFFGGAAAAVLLGWPREDDGALAIVLSSLDVAGDGG